MKINSDINVLGGMPDWNLINVFLNESIGSIRHNEGIQSYTTVKTERSVKRYEKAISDTLIKFINSDVDILIRTIINEEDISEDSLFLLFWNASFNNQFLNYINQHVYFLAFYSGRFTIKKEEVSACVRDLEEIKIKKWSDSSIETTSSKYLTLLKKFNLMSGGVNKKLVHPYLNDKLFVLFIYWLKAVESKSNLLSSQWLKYSFCDRDIFIERLIQKKFSKFYLLQYTGDKLNIETAFSYEKIYDAVK